MLWLTTGNVKEGRMKEFQEWVKKNEDLMQKYAPMGWRYRGAYGFVLGFGPNDVATLWECTKYADFDAWRNHDDPTWKRLVGEFVDFFDTSTLHASLLREMGDVKIVEPVKPKKTKTE